MIFSRALSKFFILPALIGLLASVSFSGCERNRDDRLQIYHGYLSDDPKTLDPAVAYDQIDWDVIAVIYETLYEYSYLEDPYQVVPLLADGMPKYSKDRKTVTIRIRDDVTFQDDTCFKLPEGRGRKLRAQDFIFAWKRLARPSIQSQGFWIFDDKVVGLNAFRDRLAKATPEEFPALFNEPIEGLQAIDDQTIQIKLTRPYPQLLYVLALPFSAPVAREAANQYGDETGHLPRPVGTGPFVLKTWDRGSRVILERNPHYRAAYFPTKGNLKFQKDDLFLDSGKVVPFLDRVSLEIIKEQQPAWLKFLRGELDKTEIPKDNYGDAISNRVDLNETLKEKGIRLAAQREASFYYLSVNMKDPLVGKNLALRQAISSAIDREKFIDLFLNGRGVKMTSAIPEGIADRPSQSKLLHDFNVEKARKLVAQSGYRPSQALTIEMRDSSSLSRQMGEFFVRSLEAVGIQASIFYNTSASFKEKLKNSNFQLAMERWILDYPDAENVFQLLYGKNASPGPNSSSYNRPEFNRWFIESSQMESSPERQALVARMENQIQSDLPWIYLCNRTAYRLIQPWLKNYRQAEMILNKFKFLRVDAQEKLKYQKR